MTDEAQKVALSSIIEDLEAMGLKTPPEPAPITDRQEDKSYQYETDAMMQGRK